MGTTTANYITMNRRARRRRIEGRNTKQQLERIYHRDNGICQICELPCKRADATRDHYPKPFHLCTIEEARSDSNVRLAHLWCNHQHGSSVYTSANNHSPKEITQNIGLLFPQLAELGIE